jgi:hypothetical protein
MSALGQKRTLFTVLFNVCFTPESGHASPLRGAHIAEAMDATLKAMKEAEEGWERAMNKIAERAGRTASVTRRYAGSRSI